MGDKRDKVDRTSTGQPDTSGVQVGGEQHDYVQAPNPKRASEGGKD